MTTDNKEHVLLMNKKETDKHLTEIYELLVGDNGINRYTPKELIEYIKVQNEQIVQWENETHERFIP